MKESEESSTPCSSASCWRGYLQAKELERVISKIEERLSMGRNIERIRKAYQAVSQKDTKGSTLRSRNPSDRQFRYLSSPDRCSIPVDSKCEYESSHRARSLSPLKSKI